MDLFVEKLGEQARFKRALRAFDNLLCTFVALGLFSERRNCCIRPIHLEHFTKRHYIDRKIGVD